MDFSYVVQTLLKILISTPAILIICSNVLHNTHGAALMGDGNGKGLANISAAYYDYEFTDSQELDEETEHDMSKHVKSDSEEIPNPSPLVLPGYNLPENIFNHGKPFYGEKDPITGNVEVQQKMSSTKSEEDMFDYVDDEPSSNIYEKSNINRKDSSYSGHRPNDVNQLTPNFHDFLNLPVKYNSAKYVYPLISSSYASTKYQGSLNKLHNHKDYPNKITTKKPYVSPTYYSTDKYFKVTYSTTTPTTTTTKTSTTTPKPVETTKIMNLLNTGMGVGFSEEFDYYDTTIETTSKKYTTSTKKPIKTTTEIYKSTLIPSSTTKKKVLSLFEQLFGDYEELTTTTMRPTETITTEKSTTSTTPLPITTKIYSQPPQRIPASTDHYYNYEYEDVGDNIAVESKLEDLQVVPLHISTTSKPIETSTEKTIKNTEYYNYPEEASSTTTTTKPFVTPPSAMKVTSLPLGENHLTTSGYEPLKNREPIIVATQNLREKLNSEKVAPRPFEKPTIPSQNSIHIPHDQNTVSFVVGNQQNVEGGYYGTAMKETPYESNPFRPYYGHNVINEGVDEKEITLQGTLSFPSEPVGSAVTIQPQRNSEASLAIGVPVNALNKQTPGQVLDDKLEINNPIADENKNSVNNVVFPNEKSPEYPDLVPPPREPASSNREVLKLSSSPLLHQLPSDLTPPREQESLIPKRTYNGRPPWDPRPGHFYSGNPEYNRPPRPHTDVAYKRIDNLPNILPQFRPSTSHMNKFPQNYSDKKLSRQPLLDRPSNRPISFFEKLQPPPPPPPNFLIHRNIPASRNKNVLPKPNSDENIGSRAEDRIVSEDQPGMYQTPPQIKIANRRADIDVTEIETLQMIQAKNADKRNKDSFERKPNVNVQPEIEVKQNAEKTIYKVYPVNSTPIKMDVIDDNHKKESVVVGTVSERPLPPSKINQDFNLLFDSKDRNDDPILKPHKPATYPVKSDFPYPLERPGLEGNLNVIPVPETPTKVGNDLDDHDYFSSNNWHTIDRYEPKIISGQRITVTLKAHTDKPIAVAYTPTEPNANTDKYSMPNYGSPVIPEIRPSDSNNIFTVNAVMHTHHNSLNSVGNNPDRMDVFSNHKNDVDIPDYPKLDFEAPFQASLKIDNAINQGWSIVKNTTSTERPEETTLPYATTSEFDIENFKPQLEGGFKPIFNFPEDNKQIVETKVNDRDE